MSLSTKILMTLVAIFLICLGGFVVYKQIETSRRLDAIQESMVEQKQLLDNISRAQAQYASKEDLELFAKQRDIDLDVIKKDLEKLNAQVKAIGGITVVSKNQNVKNVPSTNTTPGTDAPKVDPKNDPFGYLTNTQHLTLNEKFSNVEIPFGSVGFSAWKEKPWEFNIAERKYNVTSVLGQDENGRHYSYSKFSIQTGGKTYDVKIDSNKFMEEYPESKFHWFNLKPSLQFGGGFDVTGAQPTASAGVGASVMSYGRTKVSPDLTFVKPTASYDFVNKELNVGVVPIEVNVGKALNSNKYFQNTYIGPSVGVGIPSKSVTVGAAVGLSF